MHLKKQKMITNDQEIVKDMYFVNGMVVCGIFVLSLLSLFVFAPFDMYVPARIANIVAVLYMYMVVALQAGTFISAYHDRSADGDSLTSTVAYIVGIALFTLPIMYLIGFRGEFTFTLGMLAMAILFCNAINLLARRNRETKAAIVLNSAYAVTLTVTITMAAMLGIDPAIVYLPVLAIYAFDHIMKSADVPYTWYSFKRSSRLAMLPVLLAGLSFLVMLSYVSYTYLDNQPRILAYLIGH